MRRSTSAARSTHAAANLHALAPLVATASLALLAALGPTGCEDGPTQPFSPAPAGASSTWDNTHGSNTDPATKDFSYLHGGTNANVICDGPTLAKTWANMDGQPIIPPVGGGGLDMAGPDCALSGAGSCSWQGLTIEQAEQTLCQSTNEGDLFGDGALTNCWGDSAEVCAHYLVTTHKIDFMSFSLNGPGYSGAITATGCPGTVSNGHTYVIPIYSQMQKDNRLWEVDWTAPPSPTDWRNEVTSAILCTYAPGLAHDPDCNASGRCIQGNFGDVAYLFITPVGVGIWTANENAAQPTPSVPARLDVYLTKVTPYAGASPFFKIDGTGPTASAGVLNAQLDKPCVLQFGLAFGDFLSRCVEVDGDTTKNNAEYNKLIGGITHNDERWGFDVQGVDVNFGSGNLGLTQVLNDTSLPAQTDVSSSFSVDQYTLGPIVHDYVGNDPTQKKDLHGYALVYLQFLRRAQADLNAAMAPTNPAFNHLIGDMSCAGDPPKTMPPAGCTGLETAITPLPPALLTDTPALATSAPLASAEVTSLLNAALPSGMDVTATNAPDVFVQMRIGLKPGHQKTAFCDDHSATGLVTCDEAWLGDTFSNSFKRVLAVMGNNNALALPLDVQDARFFFKEWTYALIQYFKAEGAAVAAGVDPSTITLADVAAQTFDSYNLFFDSNGAGQYESAEYIERTVATNVNPPLDFSISADVKNGIFDDYAFERYLYRGETAMYEAMHDLRKGSSPLGSQDTALLTNMFGSPVLRSGWSDHTKDPGNNNNPTYTAYYCATNKDAQHCGKDLPPLNPDGSLVLDEEGNPLLSHYEGAFGSSATAFTLGGGANPSVPVPVTLVNGQGDTAAKNGTFPDIQEALISVPLHVDPYDQTSAPPPTGNPAVEVLVPWAPKQPGVGFPVSIDGSRDRFIQTYQLDLSGSQITANVDYDFVLNATGQPATPPQLLFLAVETTDFLGDVFLCQDRTTRDLLTARMYTSVADILDWLAAHPTAYNDCQIIIRYSPYGNYPDYISSIQNGVRLGVTQGGGYGRIVDGTLFDPTLPNN